MSLDTKFQKYDPDKHYEIGLLPGGENRQTFPRSKGALQAFKTGNIGCILVSGGRYGLAVDNFKKSDAVISADYLLTEGMPIENLFIDTQSHETLGELAFPVAKPMPGNPKLKDAKSILLITEGGPGASAEKGHAGRALKSAEKVFSPEQLDYLAVPGQYSPGLVTNVYEKSLDHLFRFQDRADPDNVVKVLEEKLPFYDPKWFDKPLGLRRAILGATCISWWLRT